MSAQIDDDLVTRYLRNKWCLLKGYSAGASVDSTFVFLKEIIGFDLEVFMRSNQAFFKSEIKNALEQLLKAE
jgi:hypothetical protein